MTAVIDDEVKENKSGKRSKYRAVPDISSPTGDIMDDIGAGPQTAQDANADFNEAVEERDIAANEALQWVRGLEISSIKYLGSKVYFEFEHKIQSFKAKTKATSTNEVPQSFTEALKNIAQHVSRLIFRALDEQNWQAQYIEPKGVNLKHYEDGNTHAGISFTLTLANGRTMSAHTPMMPLHGDTSEGVPHDPDAAKAIEEFLTVAQALFLANDEQGSLFASQME